MKAKPKRLLPNGMLQSISIPARPFEMISMDFIMELPKTAQGHDAILVVVDKLTRFVTLIPTTSNVNESETAELLFKHVICKYGLPRQIISDRDQRWVGSFLKEVSKLLNIKRALTTSHHSQADGQTEIMNQILEIALRCYVQPERNDWDTHWTLSLYPTTPPLTPQRNSLQPCSCMGFSPVPELN